MVKHKLAYNWLSHKGQDFLIWKQEKRLLCNYCFHQNLSTAPFDRTLDHLGIIILLQTYCRFDEFNSCNFYVLASNFAKIKVNQRLYLNIFSRFSNFSVTFITV